MNLEKLFEQYKKWKENEKEQALVDASEDDNVEIKLFSKHIGKKLDYDIMCELESRYDDYLIEQEYLED